MSLPATLLAGLLRGGGLGSLGVAAVWWTMGRLPIVPGSQTAIAPPRLIAAVGGVALLLGGAVDLFWSSSDGPERPVPVVGALVGEALVGLGVAVPVLASGVSLGWSAAAAAAVGVPLGVAYTTRVRPLLTAAAQRLAGHPSVHADHAWWASHAVAWTPVATLVVLAPPLGGGLVAGGFLGHLAVRGYRDVVVPIRARAASE